MLKFLLILIGLLIFGSFSLSQEVFANLIIIDELTISQNEVYTINPGDVHRVTGTLTNNGLILIKSGLTGYVCQGIGEEQKGILENQGTIINNHDIRVKGSKIVNEGTIMNKNYIFLEYQSETIDCGINNSPSEIRFISERSEFQNNGVINNEESGKIENNGSIQNSDTINNDGTIRNQLSGFIVNDGDFVNNGVIISDGGNSKITNNEKIHNTDSGTIKNSGQITNKGDIVNDYKIHNYGTIINENTLDNNRFISNDGEFTNNKTINNKGSVYNYDEFNNKDVFVNDDGKVETLVKVYF